MYVRKFSNATFFRQIVSQNLQHKDLGFSGTETYVCNFHLWLSSFQIKLEESLENFLKESALLEKVKEEPQDTDEEENQGKDELIDRLIERFRPRNYELIKKIYDDNKVIYCFHSRTNI